MATRAIFRLSALDVKRALRPGKYADGGGLYLKVNKDGSRSWIFRYRFGSTRRHFGLGSLATTSLAQARQAAANARRQLLMGEDPIAVRQAKVAAARLADAKAQTFSQCTTTYVTAKRAGWTRTHARQWTSSLTKHAHPIIGDLSVQAIDTALVMKVLEPLWTKNTETASRVRSRIESILDWAKVRGYRDGDNPARWQGHLDHLLPTKSSVAKVKHHPAMPYAELPAFMTTLRAAATPAARALEFTILTASRSGEVLGADWSEIDLATKTWTVPAARMKEKRTHCVPLSDAAIAALGTPGTGLVFNARPGHPLNKNAFMELLRRAGHGVTAHGFRSTFRDWAAEQTDFAFEVVEMSLAHKVGNEVSRAYFRSDLFDRRRFLMDAWAAFCSGVKQADNVMTLRRA
jgi:integrase